MLEQTHNGKKQQCCKGTLDLGQKAERGIAEIQTERHREFTRENTMSDPTETHINKVILLER